MDFKLSEDRQLFADGVNRFLADRYAFAMRQQIAGSEPGYSADIWRSLAELGIHGALFDEAVGGFGGKGFDISLLFEAFGRVLLVEPLLGTLMAGTILARAGGHGDVLSSIMEGKTIAAFAHQEPQNRYALDIAEMSASRGRDGWILTGEKIVIPQIEAADVIIVSAQIAGREGLSLFMVPASAGGVTVRGYPMIDGGRGGDLRLDGVVGSIVGAEGGGAALIEHAYAAGIVALCAEAVGIMDVIKEATVDYLRTRTQFGVPIGKFQAIQHRMASMLIEIEQARSAMINAAAALEASDGACELAVSAAKFTIGRVGTIVAEEAIQLHGGIGMTWELPLPHYAKRLIMIGHQLGDEDHHLERYVRLREREYLGAAA